jgi:hypothetical protein
MRQSTKLLFTAFLLVAAVTWCQQPYQALGPDLLVRLSYEQRWPDQKTCISVSQDGEYRIIAPSYTTAGTVHLKGKLTDDQLLRLKKMLTARELRSMSPNDAGMIRDHAENFRAEIWRVEMPPAFKLLDTPTGHPRTPPGPPQRMHWLNADDASPFPAPIAKLIDWMQDFRPKNAERFDDSGFREDVCPSVGLSLVQPSVATNQRP